VDLAVVKGFPVGRDGRVHTTFTHNPSSLRLSSARPNLTNIPRVSGGTIARWVKECFVCPTGHTFWERDFSGIEAVLVGYFAGSQRYTRLAKLGVHAYFAGCVAGRVANLEWPDSRLKEYFEETKAIVGGVAYDTAKRCIHGSNYMMTPKKMHYEYPETFPSIKAAARHQGAYFELLPEIPAWHRELCVRVDGTKRKSAEDSERVDPWTLGVCYAQNPFGYIHRFYNVLDWEKLEGQWVSSLGEDAKRLVSFLPQSTAAAIIKAAGRRLWTEFPTVAATMRLWIHDAILGEAEDEEVEECLKVSKLVMEAPWPELPLDPSWGMGEYLSIGTEAKAGKVWADMTKVRE
jgi:hypothetical protein